MIATRPDHQTLLAAVELANRAPAVHDAQPWRWLMGNSSIHLMADRTRHGAEYRDVLLGCGAALHHLRTAFAALGWATVVHRVPNDHDPGHLAAIEPRPHVPTDDDVALAAAITHRRTDRLRLGSEHLDLLVRRAARAGALLVPVRTSTPARRSRAGGVLVADAGQLLVVASFDDEPVSVLRAGEAVSAVLLTATVLGLGAWPVAVRDRVVDGVDHPQMIVRVGGSVPSLPGRPARRTEDTVDYLPGTRHC
ncbi:hypothetical protein [Actinophytocola sp. KF-1]